jgi:hypothetical protein
MPRYLALIHRPETEQETCESREFQTLFQAYEAFSQRAVTAGVQGSGSLPCETASTG